MRLTFFTDIHGNLPALEAILEATADADLLIFGGDAIGMGPQPAECVARLAACEGLVCLRGNHDDWLLEGSLDFLSYVDHHAWGHDQIGMAGRVFIAGWPFIHTIDEAGITALHYPRTGPLWQPILHAGPEEVERFDHLFRGLPGDLILYGHHHPKMDVTGRARYVNPGAAGCHDRPEARYCTVDWEGSTTTVTHHAAPYDDDRLMAAFRARDIPHKVFVVKTFFGGRFAV